MAASSVPDHHHSLLKRGGRCRSLGLEYFRDAQTTRDHADHKYHGRQRQNIRLHYKNYLIFTLLLWTDKTRGFDKGKLYTHKFRAAQ
jgi:hypothetical protein